MTPNPGARPNDSGEQPTEHISSVPSPPPEQQERTRRSPAPPGAGGAAAGGAAAAASGAAGATGAGASGRPDSSESTSLFGGPEARQSRSENSDGDPGLITHRASQGGYNYYTDDPYEDDFDSGYTAHDRYVDDPEHDEDFDFDDDLPPPEDPDEDMNAARKKHGRRKLWRRIRRTCYVAAALMIVTPAAVFAWCYFTFDITSPKETAANYNTSLVVNYSDGSLLNKFSPSEGENRVLIDSLDEVSPEMRHATLAAEDADFYSNPGFSVSGIGRAVYNQISGGQGGGSTITQQYVKLSTGKDAHSLERKFTEIVRAFKMTNQYDKNTILKAYLNTAYYGRGAYGISNAADAFFDKKPSELNAAESAVLAGMVQLPKGNDPRVDPERAKQRWDYVTGQMADQGWIDPAQQQNLSMPQTESMFAWTSSTTPVQLHVKQRIVSELEEHGYTQGEMTSRGLRVVTTLDKKAQEAAERSVEQVMKDQPDRLIPALSAVDPKTGAVRAYYGGSTVGRDWAAYPQPPGSSFKPFVTAAGLKQGYGIGEVYDGSSPQTIWQTEFENAAGVRCDNPKRCGVREATTNSVNTAFVNMAAAFGPKKVAEVAHEAGIPRERTVNGKKAETLVAPDSGDTNLGIALGAYPVTTANMANAYGALADGKRAETNFVKKVVTSDGELVEKFSNTSETAFASSSSESRNIAANVTESMLDVAEHSHLTLDGDRPVASKSGTHQLRDTGHNERAWYVGYTPQLSTAVSMNAETRTGRKPLLNKSEQDIYGAGLPGDIWQRFMNAYHEGKPVEQLPKPSEKIGQYTTPPPPSSEPPESATESSEPPTSSSEPPTSSSGPSYSSSEPPTSSSTPTETTDCNPYWDPGCDPEDEERDNDNRQQDEYPNAQEDPVGNRPRNSD